MMLAHALKEWAVICTALATGRQCLILRKGGIAEPAGEFELEERRFWLFPTFLHQNARELRPDALPLLDEAIAQKPGPGIVRIGHFAQVEGVYQLHNMVSALRLAGLHVLSNEAVQSRFTYRRPGLLALVLRVHRAQSVQEIPETPAYAGCHSWVKLDRQLSTDGAIPVLDDLAFERASREIHDLLEPSAFM
jgi:hypothetical protein